MADEVLDILFELAEDKEIDRRPLTQRVILQLRQLNDDLDKKILTRLGKLDRKLTGTSLWNRTKRYVLHTTWDEDYRFRGDDYKESKLPSKRVRDLAKEYMQDIAVFSEHIPRLVKEDGHRLHEFGVECGKLAEVPFDNTIILQIESGHPDVNGIFLGGYLFGVRKSDTGRWENLLYRLLHNETTRKIAIHCIWSSGFTESLIRDMLVLFKAGKIEANAFNRFAFRQDKNILSDSLFQQIITTLLPYGNARKGCRQCDHHHRILQ